MASSWRPDHAAHGRPAPLRGAHYRESANSVANASQPLGNHVALADQVATTAAEQSQSPRMDHDVLRLAAFVDQIRGMPSAATAVGLTLHAVANDLEQFATWRDGIDAALANAETPDDVVEANRALVRLELALDQTCTMHARAIARASLDLERAFAATVSGFSPPIITNGADFLVSLASTAALAGVDVAAMGYNPAEIRAAIEVGFEGVHGDDLVIAVLRGSSGAIAAAYWNTLSEAEHIRAIETRPDVAAKALVHGRTFTESELRALDEANAYPVFTEEIAAEFEASVGMRGVMVEVGGGYVVAAIKMSDGTVQVAVARSTHGGVGGEVPTLRGDVEATVGIFTSATTVFVFPNEAAAAGAIEDFRSHAKTSWMDQFDTDMFGLPVSDDEVSDLVEELWAGYGMRQTGALGINANFEADLHRALAVKEIELDVTVAQYDTTTTALSDQPPREGVIVAGSFRLDVDTTLPGGPAVSGAGAASADVAFTVDVYTTDIGERFATVTLRGSATGGLLTSLQPPGALQTEVESAVKAGAQVTVEITEPVASGGSDADVVSNILEALLNEGGGDVLAMDGREDQEVTVTIDGVVERSVDVQAGVPGYAEVDYELTTTTVRNIETWHKLPDGVLYSRTEVDQAIVAHLPAPEQEPPFGEQESEMTDAEADAVIMGDTDAAWLEPTPGPDAVTSVHQVGAAELAGDVDGAPRPELDNFPTEDSATALDYAAVVDTYGDDATVAYDQAGRPLYIDTGHGEVIELNDSDYPAVPYER